LARDRTGDLVNSGEKTPGEMPNRARVSDHNRLAADAAADDRAAALNPAERLVFLVPAFIARRLDLPSGLSTPIAAFVGENLHVGSSDRCRQSLTPARSTVAR
jgi:hypothetical protein